MKTTKRKPPPRARSLLERARTAAAVDLMEVLEDLADRNLAAALEQPARADILSQLSFLCRTACLDLRDLVGWQDGEPSPVTRSSSSPH